MDKSEDKARSDSPSQYLFDFWLNTYKDTMGRFVEMPGVGPYREKTERMMRGFSVFSELWSAWVNTTADLQSVSSEAMNQTGRNIFTKAVEREVEPERFKDFYKIWVDTYSETFKEFLKSGEFGEDQAKLLAAWMDFQQYNRDMLEENFLEPLNLPTKSEIDEISKEVYEVKKKVKRTLSEIEEEIAGRVSESENALSKKLDEDYLKPAQKQIQDMGRQLLDRASADKADHKLIETLNKSTSSLKEEMAGMNAVKKQVGRLDKDLASTKEEIKQIKTINKELASLNKEITALAGQVKKLTAKK